ncbi:hypothetical protein RAD16_05185 [Bradyrhizobium sp. 18BD]
MTDLFFRQVHDYDGLRDAVRARVDQLNITRKCLDEVAGLPAGFSGKLLARGQAKDVKRFGLISLGLVLQATGLRLLLVDDREALARVEPMYEPRVANQVRSDSHWRNKIGPRRPVAPRNKRTRLWNGRHTPKKPYRSGEQQAR